MILNYLSTSKLHIDERVTLCGQLDLDEFKYWQVDEDLIDSCCRHKFFSIIDDINDKIEEFLLVIPQQNQEQYSFEIKKAIQFFVYDLVLKKYEGSIEQFAKGNLKYDNIFNTNNENVIRAQAKMSKGAERAAKEAEKLAKAEEKLAKAAEKAAKANEKELEKAQKLAVKNAKEIEKQRLKEEKEATKQRLKEEKQKSKKGGYLQDGGFTIDEIIRGIQEDEDINEEETKEHQETILEQIVDEEDENEIINLQELKDEDANLRDKDELEGDEVLELMGDNVYKKMVKDALHYLKVHKSEILSPEGLETYSPKFLAMLENINDDEHKGLHLVYSQFRSMEGIGIFGLTLEANGYVQFKIRKSGLDNWEINMSEEDKGKPCFAFYTGTEEAEEREILRNIYNGSWDNIPNNIAVQLRAISNNNNLGEIIKVLMITSAGSEGINLRNTRYVHIMEPYWHPVRTEQVIGRARRICSHQNLPKELQTVEVFIYIMIFTQEQLDSEYAIELKLKDLSKQAPFLPQSSDEKLFEISTMKEQLTSQLLVGIKESSIDCATHIKSALKEGLTCLSFGQPSVNDFSYNPNYSQDENDTVAAINKVGIEWEGKEITIKSTGKKYILRLDTQQIYDYDSVLLARQVSGVRPILIGKLSKDKKGNLEIVKEKL
jgi:hypothetical protein